MIPLPDRWNTPFLTFGCISMVLLFFEFLRLILIFIFMEYGRRQERHIQQKSVGIIKILLFIWILLSDHWKAPFLTFGSIFQPQ